MKMPKGTGAASGASPTEADALSAEQVAAGATRAEGAAAAAAVGATPAERAAAAAGTGSSGDVSQSAKGKMTAWDVR